MAPVWANHSLLALAQCLRFGWLALHKFKFRAGQLGQVISRLGLTCPNIPGWAVQMPCTYTPSLLLLTLENEWHWLAWFYLPQLFFHQPPQGGLSAVVMMGLSQWIEFPFLAAGAGCKPSELLKAFPRTLSWAKGYFRHREQKKEWLIQEFISHVFCVTYFHSWMSTRQVPHSLGSAAIIVRLRWECPGFKK